MQPNIQQPPDIANQIDITPIQDFDKGLDTDIAKSQDTSSYQYVGWVPCITGQICYGFAESELGLEGQKFSAVFKEFKNIRSCNG